MGHILKLPHFSNETKTCENMCYRDFFASKRSGGELFLFNNGIMKLPCMGRPLTEERLRKAYSKKTICLFSEFKTSFPPFGSFNFQTVRTGSHFGTGFYWDALVANRSKLKGEVSGSHPGIVEFGSWNSKQSWESKGLPGFPPMS